MFVKKLPEQLGFYSYAASTHPDEFVPEPPLKNPGSAYDISNSQKTVCILRPCTMKHNE